MTKRNYTDADIMGRGRWSSEAFEMYCKLPRGEKTYPQLQDGCPRMSKIAFFM